MGTKKHPKHVTLIGMPSAGKTKVGRLLAEHLECDFVDIDDRIVEHYGAMTLQEIVNNLSPEEFAAQESSVAIGTVLSLSRPTIIATGGSMVYHEKAMRVLDQHTYIIHLYASLETIKRRVAASKPFPLGGQSIVNPRSLEPLCTSACTSPVYALWYMLPRQSAGSSNEKP